MAGKKRAELKKLWNRCKSDPSYRRLLPPMLATLVSMPATAKDRLGASALADYTLRKAGAVGRRELKRPLAEAGRQGISSKLLDSRLDLFCSPPSATSGS